MELEEFGRRVEHARSRVRELRPDPAETKLGWERIARQALHEMQRSLDDLQVAQEKLQQQSTMLAATRLALDRERQRHRALFESIPEPFLVSDSRAVIREANRAAAKLLGVPTRYLIGKPLLRFIGVADWRTLDAALERLVTRRAVMAFTILLQPRRGAARHVAMKGVATRLPGEDSLSINWSVRDVSVAERAEAKVRRLNHDLQLGVRQRTAQLEAAVQEKDHLLAELDTAREAALTAQRDAEAANRAKAEFLARLSHELRTPLTAIAGYTELLSAGVRGPLNDAQQRDLERIRLSQRHLTRLVEEILDHAKLELGRVELDLALIPLRQVLATVDELVMPQLEAKELRYSQVLDSATLHCYADREKVIQILVNLLSNAIKFTSPGGAIEVRGETHGTRVHIIVSDTGRGVASELLGRIFEPFVRLPGATPREHPGTGLGLAISREFARAMGGDLWAESVRGQGARFVLALPCEE
jgi:PAS domain S-box-containing protein